MRSTIPMMKQIYKMAEWHARAKQDRDGGMEYPLKMIEKWAAPSVNEDMWKARLATTKLYCRLTVETADMLGYDTDFATSVNVSEWVQERYAARG